MFWVSHFSEELMMGVKIKSIGLNDQFEVID